MHELVKITGKQVNKRGQGNLNYVHVTKILRFIEVCPLIDGLPCSIPMMSKT